ncbi:MAG: hypothetical protein L0170_14250, partial [Acidobacteria bacterium]|nr:hypothetical protein [Acidobacteriota bacterium]
LLLPLAASVVHLILPHSSTSTHCALCRLNHVPAAPAPVRVFLERMLLSCGLSCRSGPALFISLSRTPFSNRGPPDLLRFEP